MRSIVFLFALSAVAFILFTISRGKLLVYCFTFLVLHLSNRLLFLQSLFVLLYLCKVQSSANHFLAIPILVFKYPAVMIVFVHKRPDTLRHRMRSEFKFCFFTAEPHCQALRFAPRCPLRYPNARNRGKKSNLWTFCRRLSCVIVRRLLTPPDAFVVTRYASQVEVTT